MKTNLSRRDFLARASAGALGAGLWTGRLSADEARGENGAFDFLQVNDLHFTDEKLCAPWFERAFALMRESAPRAEFVLVSGDLTSNATDAEFGGLKNVLTQLKLPVHVTPGNHDYTPDAKPDVYDRHFPGKRNHAFEHRGWQFLNLNSSESTAYRDTRVPQDTLDWAGGQAGRFDPRRPTVISTHFPVGMAHAYRPKNADALLAPFRKFNVQHIFNGHWHGYSEMEVNGATVTTNRCCSRARGNHDGSSQKGWFVCTAKDGRIARRFVAPPELADSRGRGAAAAS